MIDWVSCVVPVRHKTIMGGQRIQTDKHSEVVFHGITRDKVRGSYESSIQCKTQNLSDDFEYGSELYIDGNPSKFLQGHNVIGSDDIITLVLLTVKQVLKANGQELDAFSERRILEGDFALYRVDINYSYELPSQSDVMAWIRSASVQSKTRHGLPELKKTTLYWGKGSTTWMFKAYSKFAELTSGKKQHRLPRELLNTPLLAFSENKLRLELQLRKELKKIAIRNHGTETFYAKYLTPTVCRELFNEYLGRIEMADNFTFKDADLLKLPNACRGSYELWRKGHDVKSILHKPTFYRHRKQIKQVLGCDIALPAPSASAVSNVVPLVRPLEAKPAKLTDELLPYVIGL